MRTITLMLLMLGFGLPAYADKGEVVKEDVCGTGNAIIETTDGWYIAAEHYSGVYLYEGDVVFGNLKTFGFQEITRNDGVIVKSGVWPVESSGDLVNIGYLNSIFKCHTGYHLGQVMKSP